METIGPDLPAFLERAIAEPAAVEEDEIRRILEAVAHKPETLQGLEEKVVALAEKGNSSLRQLSCSLYALLLSQEPGRQTFLAGLQIVSTSLTQPDTPVAGLHLLRTVLRSGFDGALLLTEGMQCWTRFDEVLIQLLSAVESATVTFQCSAIRMFVDALLLYTSPPSSKLGIPAKQVAERVQAILKVLLAWVRNTKTPNQASCLTIAAVNCCAFFVTKRPGQAGRVLPSLITLTGSIANSRNFSAASIQKVLKRALAGMWASDSQALAAWKSKIKDALKLMGVDVEATSKGKEQSTVVSRGSSSRLKDKAGATEQAPAAQPIATAVQDPRLQPSRHTSDPRLPPGHDPAQRPLPGQEPSAGRSDPANSVLPGPPALQTRHEDLMHTVGMMAQMLAHNNLPTCLNTADGLSATYLADLVMAMMVNLPRREEIADAAPHQGEQKSGIALLAGLMQATTSTSRAEPAQMQPASSRAELTGVQAGQAVQSAGNSGPVQPAPSVMKSPTVKRTPPAPPASPPPAPREIKLAVADMDAEKRMATQAAAIRRIASCKASAVQDLKGDLLSHLLPQLEAERWSEQMMSFITEQWDESAYELALKWLFSNFVATRKVLEAPSDRSPGLRSKVASGSDEAMDSGVNGSTAEIKDGQYSEKYVDCLQRIISFLREKLPAKDRTLAKLFVDAPALPSELLKECLADLQARGGDYATLALIAARDVIINRPANRAVALDAILHMAVSKDSDMRAKSVRLIANKLFPETFLTEAIQEFAGVELEKLKIMLPPPQVKQADEAVPGAKRARAEGDEAQDKADNTADGAELSSEAKLPEQPASKKPKTVVERVSSATDIPEEAAAPVDSGRQSDSPEIAARHCELYCALCTKRHALLVHLFTVYGQCKDRSIGRAAVMRNAEGLARVLGPEAPALLALVAQNPPGSLPLLLKMLNFLTEVQTPPQVLVQACRERYERTREPGIVATVLANLPEADIRKLLPSLLTPLSLFNLALHRLLQIHNGQSKMSPTDILLALHSLDHTKDGVKLKQIMAALDHCLSLRAKFDKSVLATVLQNLIQRPTLPPLYMRFMMQAQAAIPTLKSLIVHQLSTLVNEQIWTNKSLFLGWNLAVRQNVPESFPAFLQLPARILSETLAASPEDFRKRLKDWADSPSCPTNQKGPIQRLLESAKPNA